LDVKVIKTEINQSPLIGVFLKCLKNKVVVGEDSIYPRELELLEKEGLKVKLIGDYNAIGNLITLNSKFGIASPLLKKETIKEISKFFNVTFETRLCAGIELPGSNLYANDNFFIVNPNIKKSEFEYYKKKFETPAVPTTLNYGDASVGNDLIANKNAVIVGSSTSNIELMKIDSIVVEFD
jgi:translation initiation factor 6 (eIF-6)